MIKESGTRIMKIFFVFVFLLPFSFVFAQKEAQNWFFGYQNGLDFSTIPPKLTNSFSSNANIDRRGGMACISDSTGKLLFYTDGITVWDATNKAMPNGTGLTGRQGQGQHYAATHP